MARKKAVQDERVQHFRERRVAPRAPRDLHDEQLFLEKAGSQIEDDARAARIMREFLRGFDALRGLGPCVTVFGSARFDPEHRYYKLAVEVGEALARAGFAVMTGGGPGIMEAANRGAKQAGGLSIGINIWLPHEQSPNEYLDRYIDFNYFFVRKVMLVKYSSAFIVMPGGIGTLDEMFEVMALMQTGKMENFPLVLMDGAYWSEMGDFFRKALYAAHAVVPEELEFGTVVDTPAQALRFIRKTLRANKQAARER